MVNSLNKKFGDCAFFIAGPRSWNSVEQFKGLLKTHLFYFTINIVLRFWLHSSEKELYKYGRYYCYYY